MRDKLSWFFKLKYCPNLSMFLFDYESWSRIYFLKKFLKEVDPMKSKKIIDVGGGAGGLALILNRKDIHIFDINPNAIEAAKKKFTHVTLGDGIKMIFPDNHFDYAISTHTLEHVPIEQRASFLSEMVRISRHGIYLLFPEGQYARLLCESYNKSLLQNGKPENKWTLEHLNMGLPEKELIMSFLKKSNKFDYSYTHVKNYYAENFFWSNFSNINISIIRFIFSPLLSIYRHLKLYSKPSVELLVIGKPKQQN